MTAAQCTCTCTSATGGIAATGCGIVTAGFASTAELLAATEAATGAGPAANTARQWLSARQALPPAALLDNTQLLAQVSLQSAYEALGRSGILESGAIGADRIATLVCSGFGPAEATADFLKSLFEAGGKYASPRQFSRSVHAAIASVLAIALKLKGPCATLSYRDHAVTMLLRQAGLLLRQNRCDAVLACWADWQTPLTVELCARAADALRERPYARFGSKPGYGATALVLQRPEDAAGRGAAMLQQRALPPCAVHGAVQVPRAVRPAVAFAAPWPTDAAAELLAAVCTAACAPESAAAAWYQWAEPGGDLGMPEPRFAAEAQNSIIFALPA